MTNQNKLAELGRMALSPPNTMATADISEHDRLDHRVSMVNVVFPNTVGMNVGYLEWCPNGDPPGRDEILGWLWVLRPEWSLAIANQTQGDFLRDVIRRYLKDERLR